MKMKQIIMHPIGRIRSPYKKTGGIPIQGYFGDWMQGYVELKQRYTPGLEGLEGFSHAIILYYFHKSPSEDVKTQPFLEQVKHGIFAIRSPHRPNHIGLSVVKIEKIEANKLYFSEVDMLDKTPVLDIKPYVKYFDSREDVKCGWLDKHFRNGKVPDKCILG